MYKPKPYYSVRNADFQELLVEERAMWISVNERNC